MILVTLAEVPAGRIPPPVLDICRRLRDAGHRAWIVGGCLRDLLADDPKKLVVLQGDQSVMLGEAVRVMDVAKRAGATAISIAAQKRTDAAP